MQLAVGFVVSAKSENDALVVAGKQMKEALTEKFKTWGLRIDLQEAVAKQATPVDRKP
ncbi:MAG TPA: hypothetical protein VGS11_11075 [Candidatus Bathyarchaeia archaeon]|nr:hypothetical protein [Candidatus Bathyarchaeia archaeon]